MPLTCPSFHVFNCSRSLSGIFPWVALTACLCPSLSPFTEDHHSWCAAQSHFLRGFPGGSVVNNLLLMQETQKTGSVLGWGRSPGGGHGNLLQYSCLEIFTDRGAQQATVHGVPKSWTRHACDLFKFPQLFVLFRLISGHQFGRVK